MTTIVPKGTNRPAAAKRTAKAAQRTALPPKGATSAPGKTNTSAAVIKEELAKKPARPPRKVAAKPAAAPAVRPAPNAAATILAKRVLAKDTPHTKAADLVADAIALGWQAAAEPGELPTDLVTFRAVRGERAEEVVTLHWITGGTRVGSYTNGPRTVQAQNAATVRRFLATPAEAAAKVRGAYASGKGKAKRAAVKVATAAPLPAAMTGTDEEILAAVIKKTVVWTNSISGINESAVVGGTGKNAPKVTTSDRGVRSIVFAAKGGAFRTVRLSSIVSVS